MYIELDDQPIGDLAPGEMEDDFRIRIALQKLEWRGGCIHFSSRLYLLQKTIILDRKHNGITFLGTSDVHGQPSTIIEMQNATAHAFYMVQRPDWRYKPEPSKLFHLKTISGIKLENLAITRVTDPSTDDGQAIGIWLEGGGYDDPGLNASSYDKPRNVSGGNKFINVAVRRHQRGIFIKNCTNTWMAKVVASSNTNYGMLVQGFPEPGITIPNVQEIYMRHCKFIENGEGLCTEGTVSALFVTECEFSRNSNNGFVSRGGDTARGGPRGLSSDWSLFRLSQFSSNGRNGVELSETHGTTFTNCLFEFNQDHGVLMFGGTDQKLYPVRANVYAISIFACKFTATAPKYQAIFLSGFVDAILITECTFEGYSETEKFGVGDYYHGQPTNYRFTEGGSVVPEWSKFSQKLPQQSLQNTVHVTGCDGFYVPGGYADTDRYNDRDSLSECDQDHTDRILEALSTLRAADGGTLYLHGCLKIKRPINLPDNITVRGDNWLSTRLVGTHNGAVIDISKSRNIIIQDLAIEHYGAIDAQGIQGEDVKVALFDNIYIGGRLSKAVTLKNGSNITLRQIQVRGTKDVALEIIEGSNWVIEDSEFKNWHVEDTFLNSGNNLGCSISGSFNIRFDNSHFMWHKTHVVIYHSKAIVHLQTVLDNSYDNTVFLNNVTDFEFVGCWMGYIQRTGLFLERANDRISIRGGKFALGPENPKRPPEFVILAKTCDGRIEINGNLAMFCPEVNFLSEAVECSGKLTKVNNLTSYKR